MTKKKMYKYLGRNGNITTPVLLDGIEHIPMYYVVADKDRLLTQDGESFYTSITIEEKELDNWYEVDGQL